jgi:hypothetical protein
LTISYKVRVPILLGYAGFYIMYYSFCIAFKKKKKKKKKKKNSGPVWTGMNEASVHPTLWRICPRT